MFDDVTLTIGKAAYGGWESVDINRSIETISGSCSLSVSERWPGQQVVAQVRPGASCKVTLGGDTVITGYVDEVLPEYDKSSHEVRITIRDAMGDLVDCSAKYIAGQRFNADVVGLITTICQPFGIKVRSDITGLKPIPEFVIHPGQTAFEAIQQLCSYAALLPISDGKGTLVLTRGGMGGAQAALGLGKNILKAGGHYSSKDRYSTYTVLGQANGSGDIDPDTAIGGKGVATDAGVTRYRPLVIIADFMAVGDGAYQQRALWEATVRAGRAYSASLTVTDWRDDAGAIWQPNALVRLDDDFLALHDTLLISGVRYSRSLSGSTTTLSVTRRQAFDLLPMPASSGFYDPTPSGQRVGNSS